MENMSKELQKVAAVERAFEKAPIIMEKWNGDEGATTEELKSLRSYLSLISNAVSDTIALRVEEEEAEGAE